MQRSLGGREKPERAPMKIIESRDGPLRRRIKK